MYFTYNDFCFLVVISIKLARFLVLAILLSVTTASSKKEAGMLYRFLFRLSFTINIYYENHFIFKLEDMFRKNSFHLMASKVAQKQYARVQ